MTKDEIVSWGKKHGWVWLTADYQNSLYKQWGDLVLRITFSKMKATLWIGPGDQRWTKISSAHFKWITEDFNFQVLRCLGMFTRLECFSVTKYHWYKKFFELEK